MKCALVINPDLSGMKADDFANSLSSSIPMIIVTGAPSSMVQQEVQRENLTIFNQGGFDRTAFLTTVRNYLPDKAQKATVPEGGIDFNKNMNVSAGGDKIDIRFDKAMINQFERGGFTGVRPRILSVTPLPGGVLAAVGPGAAERR